MKFISLFTKAPNYKRFSYTPRFYDSKLEERKEREERIKHELALERGEKSEQAAGYRARITGSFQAARRRSSTSSDALKQNLIRFGVLLFIVLFLIAYLTWGKPALYSLVLFVPIYFYLKFKKKK